MNAPMPSPVLAEARKVTVDFGVGAGWRLGSRARVLRALDQVSLGVNRGEALGLIGESGSGKSTLGRVLLGITRPTGGTVTFDGKDVSAFNAREHKSFRQRSQLVFQDPASALNPRMTVGGSLAEHLRNQGFGSRVEVEERVRELFALISMDAGMARRFPHELSGGQKQRVVIARAIATDPEFVVADEPVSALDVSVRAQILNLLRGLQERLGLALLFISHDLSVVAHVSQRIAVLYLGKIVEIATRDELFARPLHPYTHALLSAVPIPDPARERRRKRIVLQGEVPSPIDRPTGCPLHNRCPRATAICRIEVPLLEGPESHQAACHHPGSPAMIPPQLQ